MAGMSILRFRDGERWILLQLRPFRWRRNQGGKLCRPCGGSERCDRDRKATAMRETLEEANVETDRRNVHQVGGSSHNFYTQERHARVRGGRARCWREVEDTREILKLVPGAVPNVPDIRGHAWVSESQLRRIEHLCAWGQGPQILKAMRHTEIPLGAVAGASIPSSGPASGEADGAAATRAETEQLSFLLNGRDVAVSCSGDLIEMVEGIVNGKELAVSCNGKVITEGILDGELVTGDLVRSLEGLVFVEEVQISCCDSDVIVKGALDEIVVLPPIGDVIRIIESILSGQEVTIFSSGTLVWLRAGSQNKRARTR
jgi:8-oxo-dGTP pyrophosphatase MutT (NUDIX family)